MTHDEAFTVGVAAYVSGAGLMLAVMLHAEPRRARRQWAAVFWAALWPLVIFVWIVITAALAVAAALRTRRWR